MKTCPTCSRVYDDETITYCLHDGSLLTTTTYDAAPPTMRVPVPRSTDPSAAATLYSDAQQSEPPPTISSSQLYDAWAAAQPKPKRSGKILLGIVALVLLGAGIGLGIALSRGYWFGGDSVARKLDTNGDGSDKVSTTSNTMLRPTPTPAPTPTPTPDTPAAERMGLVGTWSGAINKNPTTMVITSGEGNSFSGTKTQGSNQVAFVGTINPATRAVSMRETRVLKGRPYSNGTGWSLGTESGTLSADGKKLSGKGKDQYQAYTWSYTKK